MNLRWIFPLALAFVLGGATTTSAAVITRNDFIWARSTAGAPITLDGVLNEAGWAKAESMTVKYAYDAGVPGSGFKAEGGFNPTDYLRAVIKFLTVGNQLYMAAVVRDSSVGGSSAFNFFDGLLMSLKNHNTTDRPAPPSEYFYTWWHPNLPQPKEKGLMPGFVGTWGANPIDSLRSATAIANWDAVTTVQGISNSDTTADVGYTVEMRFNLTPQGYDITAPGGDILEWNISIYDCDYFWPASTRVSANRVWWQSPWGNVMWYNQVRIFCNPAVTINSGPVTPPSDDLVIPDLTNLATPAIDGLLTDPVWASAASFDIRYDDVALRNSYGPVGKWRSGQYQPVINGDQEPAPLLDPGDATVKWFVKGDSLFMGFDVRDLVVQNVPSGQVDRWDGFIVTLTERQVRGGDNQLLTRRLSFKVGAGGVAEPLDYLATLQDTLNGGKVAMALKPGTTVDTLGTQADQGYTAELKIDLTKFGYIHNLGDRLIHIGVTLLDGDSFTPFTDSYATRTWFWREFEGQCCPPWGRIAPPATVDVGDDLPPPGYHLLGAFPNPFVGGSLIRFLIPERSACDVEVFDASGRLVRRIGVGVMPAGGVTARIDGHGLAPGAYLYRVRVTDPSSKVERAVLTGKAMLLQ
jgi:hypothetical protein